MSTELIHIHYGYHLAINRVVAMLPPTSDRTKRLVEEYKSKGLVLNMTHGHRTQAVILLDTGQIVLAAITPETIASRLAAYRTGHPDHAGEGG